MTQSTKQASNYNPGTGLEDSEVSSSLQPCPSTSGTMFDALNIDRKGKYSTNGASMCFYSTCNCGGDVYNGTCENHWGLHNIRFQPVISPIFGNALIFPVSTKTHNRPVKLVPVLSMLGLDSKISLTHEDSAIQTECEFMLNMGCRNSSEYATQVSNKLHAFKQQYNGYVMSKMSELSQRTISVSFTGNYKGQKMSPFSKSLFESAMAKVEDKSGATTATILVPLNLFKNIYDIMTIMSYWPSQFSLSDQKDDVVSLVPNVHIVDGWFVGGLGFGVPAFTGMTPIKKMGSFETHSIDKRTTDQLLNKVIPIVNPVVLDYKAPPPGSLFVVRPCVTALNTMAVEQDIVPESYSTSANASCTDSFWA